MGPLAVGMIVVAGVSAISGARAQKRAARANARAIREQAAFNAMVSRREADIFKNDSEIFLGNQQSAIAKSGVDFSGSVLMQYASSKNSVDRQYNAIKEGAAQRAKMAEQEAQEQKRLGRDLATASYLQGAGSILNATSNYYNHQRSLDRNNNSQEQIDNVNEFRDGK